MTYCVLYRKELGRGAARVPDFVQSLSRRRLSHMVMRWIRLLQSARKNWKILVVGALVVSGILAALVELFVGGLSPIAKGSAAAAIVMCLIIVVTTMMLFVRWRSLAIDGREVRDRWLGD